MRRNCVVSAIILAVWIETAGGTTWAGPARTSDLARGQAAGWRAAELSRIRVEEQPLISFRHWDMSNGMPQSTVNALAQDAGGFLWVATFGGLARFDGVSFDVFTIDSGEGLGSDRILSLATGPEGSVWVGTQGAGLWRYRNGRFARAPGTEILDTAAIGTMAGAPDGTLWIGATSLWRYRGESLELIDVGVTPGAGVMAILAEADATWIGTPAHVSVIKGNRVRRIEVEGVAPGASVRARVLARGPSGQLWLGGGNGLAVFGDGVFRPVSLPAEFDAPVRSIAFEPDGAMWVAGAKGLARGLPPPVTRDDALAIPRFEQVSNGNDCNDEPIIFVDREGAIWIGTNRDGLRKARTFPAKRIRLADQHGPRSVGRVVSDRAGGVLMSLMGISGVIAIPPSGSPRHVDTVELGDPWSLLCDRQGRIWVGRLRGVQRLDADGTTTDVLPESSEYPEVAALFEDREGRVWAGGNSFLALIDEHGEVRVWRSADGLGEGALHYIYQSRDGNIWCGSDGGVSCWDGARMTAYSAADGLPPGEVRAILEDTSGSLWFGTYGGGLARFRGGKFVRISERDGLADSIVSFITEDSQKRLWMNGNKGAFFASIASLNAFADGRAGSLNCTLLRTGEGNGGGQAAGAILPSGELWLPTIHGAVVLDTRATSPQLPPAPVVFESVLLDGVPFPLSDRLEVPPGCNRVEIAFTAVTSINAELIRFRYRLSGLDADWVDCGTHRVAPFTHIPPGQYQLEVQSRRPGSDAWSTGATLHLQYPGRFYQQRWFSAAAVAAFVAGAFLTHRLRLASVARRNGELCREVARQTQELRANEAALRLARDRLEEQVGARTAELRQANQSLRDEMFQRQEVQAQRERLEERVRESQKLEAVGKLAAGLALEINDALTAIVGRAELARMRGASDTILSEHLNGVVRGVEHAAGVIRALLAFGQRAEVEKQPIHVVASLHAASKLIKHLLPAAVELELTVDVDPGITLEFDPAQFNQLRVNLATNARDAMPTGGRLRLAARMATTEDQAEFVGTPLSLAPAVVIEVRDTGVGIPEEARSHIFEPFYSTKTREHAAGMGLAVVHGIVEEHGGTIRFETEVARGTAFSIAFPICQPELDFEPRPEIQLTGASAA